MTIRLTVLLLVFSATSLLPPQSEKRAFVIRDVRIFDGESVLERQTVVIADGKIAVVGNSDLRVPQGAEEIPGEGHTLLPGLIDSHVHVHVLRQVEALQQALAFGVTTVLDMWTGPPPRAFTGKPALSRLKEIEGSDPSDMAAVRTAGTGATAPGGHPTQMDGGFAALVIPTLSRPDQAGAFVDARLSEGSDFIKIIYDDTKETFGLNLPTLNEETIAAIAAAAHAHGRIAVAHISTEQQARGAISAGVDGLAHIFMGPSVSADFSRFVAQRGTFVIPTLSILYFLCGMSDGPAILADADAVENIRQEFRAPLSMPLRSSKLSCDGATEAVRQLAAASAPVLAGTDAPAPGTTYGASLHRELEHLVKAGMTPVAALAAATSVPARSFQMNDRGRIKPGMRADLLLVKGDPTKQIQDTRNIVAIWKRGVPVERK